MTATQSNDFLGHIQLLIAPESVADSAAWYVGWLGGELFIN